MKLIVRLATACLLACLLLPQGVRAGGDLGAEPYEIGEKLLAKKHHQTALKYFGKALERGDARAHYGMGLVHEQAGKLRDAVDEYRRFLDIGQPDARHGDAARRIASLEERLRGDAARSVDLLERGKRLFKEGKFREAEKALLQAASGDDANPEIHFLLGEVYLALEAYDKAKAEYRKASRLY